MPVLQPAWGSPSNQAWSPAPLDPTRAVETYLTKLKQVERYRKQLQVSGANALRGYTPARITRSAILFVQQSDPNQLPATIQTLEKYEDTSHKIGMAWMQFSDDFGREFRRPNARIPIKPVNHVHDYYTALIWYQDDMAGRSHGMYSDLFGALKDGGSQGRRVYGSIAAKATPEQERKEVLDYQGHIRAVREEISKLRTQYPDADPAVFDFTIE